MGGARRSGETAKQKGDTKRSTRYPGSSTYRKDGFTREAQWTTITVQKMPKKLPDEVIAAAKNMFFQLDRDNSGSIDADELGLMLRSLGQNPTEEELEDLIRSVDGADGGPADGQIQLREFLRLYGDAVDSSGKKINKIEKSDVHNVFACLGGELSKADSVIEGAKVSEIMKEEFGLDVNMDETFGMRCDTMTKDDVAKILGVEPSEA